ncbi:MAG: HDOD domain-containing protein [Peptococcaceae bacterium]|nr:HDOD domain-containing protein [Peptococcaceae bacterium]
MLFYRLRQLLKAHNAKILPSEHTWAGHILSPSAQALFLRQDTRDQRHALDVALALERNHAALPAENLDLLLTAALLHDCGKSLQPVELWHRIFIVLAKFLPEGWRQALLRSATPLAFPLRLAQDHPAQGARLARNAGLPDSVCLLIAEHHAPSTALGQYLQAEDDRC